MFERKNRSLLIFSVLFILFVSNCVSLYKFRQTYSDAPSLVDKAINYKVLYLKAHLKDGELVLFKKEWTIDTVKAKICGDAVRYDMYRNISENGVQCIDFDQIQLFETNEDLKHFEDPRLAAIFVNLLANTGLTIYCALNPKACFGSCPTFYAHDDSYLHHSDAEGFSSAIMPSLEYEDVDALGIVSVNSNRFSLTMKNEAYETHNIRSVKLMAVKKNDGASVAHTPDNRFFTTLKTYRFEEAYNSSGERITRKLSSPEQDEYSPLSDSLDLTQKEEIFLTFPNADSKTVGLNLHFRQSLMSTFLFYGLIAHLGIHATEYATWYDRHPVLANKYAKIDLGNIDVYTWSEAKKKWMYEGNFHETGPIAINKQMLPLKKSNSSKETKVKLVLTKGLWRIDYASLVEIGKELESAFIKPSMLTKNGIERNDLLKRWQNNDLVTSLPGDVFKIHFDLPDMGEYQLFLSSKGYYLEWPREEWYKEQNLDKVRMMIFNPQKYYKSVTKEFKKYETEMEDMFWNSRVQSVTQSK